MKNNLLLIICLIVLTSCTKAQDKTVVIEYSNETNGYKIKSTWIPKIVSSNHVIGPAIIELYNIADSTTYTVTNNNFSILKSNLPFTYSKDSLEIKSLNKNLLNLEYKSSKINNSESFGTTDVPFFFADIDFDNVKELLIAEVGNGQRGIATFRAYQINEGSGLESKKFLSMPFIDFDEMTEIDYEGENIILYGSGGLCYNSYSIFSKKRNFNLDILIKQERNDNLNKCYQYTYKIINGREVLISKEEKQI